MDKVKIGSYEIEKNADGSFSYGGYLYLEGTAITSINTDKYIKQNPLPIIYWQNKKHMKCDGVIAEVLRHKSNVWKLKKLGSNKQFYCVTDGKGKFAHGDTLDDAKKDLIYKLSEDASKEEFAKLKMTDLLSFEKCIQMYRVVTGACSFGVKNFIESHSIENREYTVAEMLEITKGQYGSEILINFLKA